MIDSFDPVRQNPVIRAFIQDRVKSPGEFKSAICDRDEMYLYALENSSGLTEKACLRYYGNGRRILDAVRQLVDWHFQGFNRLDSFLDFASGYGRLTRFLIQELPPEKIWISDIDGSAVKFQIEQFGVHGMVSTAKPLEYNTVRGFDCILVSSFFSHVPEKTFTDWLQKLYDLLYFNGMLVFSVHNLDLLVFGKNASSCGIHFRPESESKTLDKQEYGTTYVSEEFVREAIAEITNGKASCHRIEKGLCGHQDLYIIVKQPFKVFSNLKFSHHPQGKLETCNVTPELEIKLGGWVSDLNQNSQIERVQILVNGSAVGDGEISNDDRSISRSWVCQVKREKISYNDIVTVKAVNSRGLERVLEMGTLESIINSGNPSIKLTSPQTQAGVLAIAGMHRSGTSLTASLLENAGVHLGNRLVGVDVGNDKGHFEDIEFVEFHIAVLRSQSLDLDGLTLKKEIALEERYVKLAKELIAKKTSRPLWGWKDPRTTLFLEFWKQLLPDARFILVYRSPWEVVDSLYRRGTDELVNAHPETAVQLWIHYNQRLLEFYEKYPDDCLLVNVRKLLESPQALTATINQKFNLTLTPPDSDLIEPTLLECDVANTHRPVLIKKFFPEALDIYLALDARASPLNGEPSLSWSQFSRSYSPQAWGFRDWWEVGSLQQKIKKEIQQIETDYQLQLRRSRSSQQQAETELEAARSQFQQLQTEAQQLNDRLIHTQTEAQQLNDRLIQLQAEAQQLNDRLIESQSQLQQTRVQLQQRDRAIATMKTSKFWKLRNLWFKFKEAIGLSESDDP